MAEEGTGLGPSLEFYALVAAELQQRSLGVWLCYDDFPDDSAREVKERGRRGEGGKGGRGVRGGRPEGRRKKKGREVEERCREGGG